MALGQGVKPPFPRTKTGCLTCRGRKVKCDEAKPSCKTCQRLKLDCRWQTDKNKLGGKSQSTTWTSDLITTTTRKPLTQKTRIPGETFVFEFPNVDRGAMQYIHHYISFCSRFLVYVNDGEGNPFQKELVPFVTTSPALRHSMVALAAGHMSRTDRQHRAKATINYAQALRELKLALEDPVSAKSNSTLGACLLLCVYEITHSDDPSWTKHLEGARDIIRYRGGPDAGDFLSRFFALLDISGGLFQGRPPLLEGNYWIENGESSTSAPSMDGQIMSEVPSASDSPSAASTIPGWPYYDSADVMIQNFHALMTYMARLSQLSSESLTPEGKRDHPRIVEKAMVIQKELFEWWESCPEALRDQSTDWRRQPRPKKLSVAETLEAEAFSSTQSCVYGCILYIAHICDPYSKQPRTTEAAAAIKSLLEIAVETPEGCGLEMGIYFGMFMCGISLFNEEDAENTIRSKLKVENLVSLYHADAALKLLETIWNRQRMFNTKFDWREVQSELKTPVFILT